MVWRSCLRFLLFIIFFFCLHLAFVLAPFLCIDLEFTRRAGREAAMVEKCEESEARATKLKIEVRV